MFSEISSSNRIIVNMTALRHNYREVKKISKNRKVMAVVKNDAYGHGLVASAHTLTQAGADSLGVTKVIEAMTLRESGIQIPIYVIAGLSDHSQIEPAIRHNIGIFIPDADQARLVAEKAKQLKKNATIHIMIDSGLGRRGFKENHLEAFLKEIMKWPYLTLEGLATHLGTAGDFAAHQQLEYFNSVCLKAKLLGFPGNLHSALNSGGLLWHPEHQAPMVRIGLMLYGVQPGPEIGPVSPDLRGSMTVYSKITHIHELKEGESVGYGHTFIAKKPMRIAVVPFGYAQGLLRSSSGRGWALIRGQRAPQIGLISMNASTYDISDIYNAALGNDVVIVGYSAVGGISAGDMAAWSSTTPYEILNFMGRLNTRYNEGSDYEENITL